MTSDTTRTNLRSFAIGALFGISIGIGLLYYDQGMDDIEAAEQAKASAMHRDSSTRKGVVIRHLEGQLALANARDAEARQQATRRVNTVTARAAGIVVADLPPRPVVERTGGNIPGGAQLPPAAQYMVPFEDTTKQSGVQRRHPDGSGYIDPRPWIVPTFVIDAYREALGTVSFLDGVVAQQMATALLADSTITARASQRRSDSLNVLSLEREVAIWKGRKSQWCGRKCGAALGVVGTGAAIYLASKVREWLNGSDQGLRVSLRIRTL